MNSTRHNKIGGTNVNTKLPPISSRDYIRAVSQSCGLNRTNSSIVAPANIDMVSQNPRVAGAASGSGSSSLLYRSIPPKPHTFTLSDMLEPNTGSQKGGGVQNKKLGLTGSSSSEFAKRFMTRPTTQPKVVEFNVSKMSAQKRRRGINGFFPPVKLRYSAKNERSQPVVELPPGPTERNPLQLIPTSYSEVRPKSASRSISRASRQSQRSQRSQRSVRKTPESVRTAPPTEQIVYPETFECDDLSVLPAPKKILPKRDLPWVFRYKVKRNMNELSKILASKPGAMVDV